MSFEMVKLGDICNKITDGAHKTPTYVKVGVPFLRVTDIKTKKIQWENTKRISKEEHLELCKRCKTEKGDLLFSKNGTIGKVKIVDWDEEFSTFVSLATIKPKHNLILSNYLAHILRSNAVISQSKKRSKTGTVTNLHLTEIRKIQIPLPPLETQKKIADALDKAQELIDKRKEQIAKMDEFLQSLFLDMFGDPVTNPKGWEVKDLEKISLVGSSKRVFVNELVENGIPFYRGTEIGELATENIVSPELFITENHYQSLKESRGIPKIGDLLMPSICPDGRIWLVDNDKPFYFKDGRVLWVNITDDSVNSIYLKYMLKNKFIYDYHNIASGTTFAELKIFALKKVKIFYPPIDLQNKFASIVEKTELEKEKLQSSLEQMEDNFNSIMQRAFKGELF